MPDVFTPAERSQVMRQIRSAHTKPEILLRKALFSLGYRYRCHVATLPGKPDIVLTRFKAAIQVRGCFWHGHNCKDGHLPHSRREYWVPKLENNTKRDRRNDRLLRQLGWRVITVWECQLSSKAKLERQVRRICSLLDKKHTAT